MDISKVEEIRRLLAKKQNLSRLFVDILVYSAFVFILMVVCYGNKNDHRYLMTNSIRAGLPGFHEVGDGYQ